MKPKSLRGLLDGVDHRWTGPEGDATVSNVVHDSRAVRKGDLFIALKGAKQDGHDFAADVAGKGAAAIVAERPLDVGIPVVVVPSTLAALSTLSARFFEEPSKGLTLVGVTGTNGKTTFTYMLESILQKAGRTVGIIGTVEYRWGKKTEKAPNTTPFSSELQGLLARMRDDGVTHVAMEVSSHALALHRVDDVVYRLGVFTNLTRDHLDFHQTMENYFEAKARLFDKLADDVPGAKDRFAIINVDDPWSEKLLPRLRVPRLTYGIRNRADVAAEEVSLSAAGTTFTLSFRGKRHFCQLPGVGQHNVYNALAAAGAALALGIDGKTVIAGLESLKGVPGRLERVDAPGKAQPAFSAFVDYAHTDDALKNVLQALRPLTSGKLITVFGCGGDRDRTKRPIMGETAGKMSDRVIVTSDNPRSEDPQKITLDIEVGLRRIGAKNYEIVIDREQAIERALAAAGKGDVVLIAGKGHETYQIFKDRTIDFDDRVVVRNVLKKLAAGR